MWWGYGWDSSLHQNHHRSRQHHRSASASRCSVCCCTWMHTASKLHLDTHESDGFLINIHLIFLFERKYDLESLKYKALQKCEMTIRLFFFLPESVQLVSSVLSMQSTIPSQRKELGRQRPSSHSKALSPQRLSGGTMESSLMQSLWLGCSFMPYGQPHTRLNDGVGKQKWLQRPLATVLHWLLIAVRRIRDDLKYCN